MPIRLGAGEEPDFWNDAEIIGDLAAVEAEGLLDQEFDILFGRSKKQASGTWRCLRLPLREIIERQLSRHKPSHLKDGTALVFARGVPNGQTGELLRGGEFELSGRKADDIAALTFAGFDLDDDVDLDEAVNTLKELGFFAIVYTSFRHRRTFATNQPSKPVDKFRILFPLAEPFALAPEDPKKHQSLCAEWSARLAGFAREHLGLNHDKSGEDVNRLFYTPRHKSGFDDRYVAIVAGRLLSVGDMPLDLNDARPWKTNRKSTKAIVHQPPTDARPILSDGFDLIEWKSRFGARFLAVDFLDDLHWDIRTGGAGGDDAEIECPNDHNHSDAGNPRDRACWIKNGDGDHSFTISCRHAHCADLWSLEMLVLLEQQAALPDEYSTLSEMLCEPHYYFDVEGQKSDAPRREQFRLWDPPGPEASSGYLNA